MERSEKDLILAPNEYVYIQDTESGVISVLVGSAKKSLAGTDQLMYFDTESQSFSPCRYSQAINQFPFVDNKSYVVLQNPAMDEKQNHPEFKLLNRPAELQFGKKVNIKGPTTFPLWPQQTAKVIEGHQLRSNQYLLIKVYDEVAANKYWENATIQGEGELKKPTLVAGQLLIVMGTDVSFYIPPTGIEVVMDESTGDYVRDAVTLERLQYCILLDESGDKRYVKGPSVVFPNPTEKFITNKGNVVFNAIELNDIMGLYIKVIADYTENNKAYKAGEEFFITGKEQKIYYPRAEHAIVKYGDEIIHYAVAIPKGEARYVLNKETGKIDTIRGPKMYLPNPIHEVIVNRILTKKQVELWYPGSREALEYNTTLRKNSLNKGYDILSEYNSKSGSYSKTSGEMFQGMDRRTEYTPPRSITLDTKYDGAVRVDVWPGYAIQLISGTGDREVVIGPSSVLLDYDQTLERLSLSTGKPKTDHDLVDTVYLNVQNNRISDIVNATTSDLVEIEVRVNYRVNFEKESSKDWFSVENYVKFLTQHCRSMIRNAVKGYDIEKFNNEYINIIRDTILGESTEGSRPGRKFKENGMKIYDVEVLRLQLVDREIDNLLSRSQFETVKRNLKIANKKQELDATQRIEEYNREIESEISKTSIQKIELNRQESKLGHDVEIEYQNHYSTLEEYKDKIRRLNLELEKDIGDLKLNNLKTEMDIKTNSFVEKLKAIQPELVAAIKSYGNTELASKLASNLPNTPGAFGSLFGSGGIGALLKMVEGTPIEKGLKELLKSED